MFSEPRAAPFLQPAIDLQCRFFDPRAQYEGELAQALRAPPRCLMIDPNVLRQDAAMIVLFTDFGLDGPYTGQVKAVLHNKAPGVPVIDLFADAPARKPKP